MSHQNIMHKSHKCRSAVQLSQLRHKKFSFAFVTDADYDGQEPVATLQLKNDSNTFFGRPSFSLDADFYPVQFEDAKVVAADPLSACSSLINSADLAGNVALISYDPEIDTCSTRTKVSRAFFAGAVAVILFQIGDRIDNFEGISILLAANFSESVGVAILEQLEQGNEVRVDYSAFVSMQDTSNLTLPSVQQVVNEINNNHSVQFTLGGGDWSAQPLGLRNLTAEDYALKKAQWLNQFKRPFIPTLGDNDWSEAPSPFDALEVVREALFPDPKFSLGKCRRRVKRQFAFMPTQEQLDEVTIAEGLSNGPWYLESGSEVNAADGDLTKVLTGGFREQYNVVTDRNMCTNPQRALDYSISHVVISLDDDITSAQFDIEFALSVEEGFDYMGFYHNDVFLGLASTFGPEDDPYRQGFLPGISLSAGDTFTVEFFKNSRCYEGVDSVYFYVKNLKIDDAEPIEFPFNTFSLPDNFLEPNVPVSNSGLVYRYDSGVPVLPSEPVDFPENQRFVHNNVVFALFHTVGDDDTVPLNPLAVDFQTIVNERGVRQAANVEWIRSTFRLAKEINAHGICFTSHARRYSTQPNELPALRTQKFRIYDDVLREECLNFGNVRFDNPVHVFPPINVQTLPGRPVGGKPVLLLRGDSHIFNIQTPIWTEENVTSRLGGAWPLPNFVEVSGWGDPNTRWVQVDVDPTSPELFHVIPKRRVDVLPTEPTDSSSSSSSSSKPVNVGQVRRSTADFETHVARLRNELEEVENNVVNSSEEKLSNSSDATLISRDELKQRRQKALLRRGVRDHY